MKTIYKYELITTDYQVIKLPIDSEILCVQTQNEIPCIWVVVETENPKCERVFEIFGTGHEIKNDVVIKRKYIGSYQLRGGGLVFHLFERI